MSKYLMDHQLMSVIAFRRETERSRKRIVPVNQKASSMNVCMATEPMFVRIFTLDNMSLK